jgi:hypothetical protein
MTGIVGKVTIDATNAYGQRSAQFASQAHEVKSIIGGPTAKSFNTNWAVLYDEIGQQRVRPSNLLPADPDARQVTDQLIVEAGFDPVFVGDLEHARMLEDHLLLIQAIDHAGFGPFFYRMAQPRTTLINIRCAERVATWRARQKLICRESRVRDRCRAGGLAESAPSVQFHGAGARRPQLPASAGVIAVGDGSVAG